MSIAKDFSLSAVIAGVITVLVGFTGAGVIVFQAAQALNASPAEIASWMWALGLGMGLTCIALSWRYRQPVVTAWSTPGAALLITAADGVSMPEAIGAFLFCGVLLWGVSLMLRPAFAVHVGGSAVGRCPEAAPSFCCA